MINDFTKLLLRHAQDNNLPGDDFATVAAEAIVAVQRGDADGQRKLAKLIMASLREGIEAEVVPGNFFMVLGIQLAHLKHDTERHIAKRQAERTEMDAELDGGVP